MTGRAEELRLIDTAMPGTGSRGGVVAVGPAGVGKNRPAREVLARQYMPSRADRNIHKTWCGSRLSRRALWLAAPVH